MKTMNLALIAGIAMLTLGQSQAHAFLIQDAPWSAGEKARAGEAQQPAAGAADQTASMPADAERAPADVSKSPAQGVGAGGAAADDPNSGAGARWDGGGRGVRAHGE